MTNKIVITRNLFRAALVYNRGNKQKAVYNPSLVNAFGRKVADHIDRFEHKAFINQQKSHRSINGIIAMKVYAHSMLSESQLRANKNELFKYWHKLYLFTIGR